MPGDKLDRELQLGVNDDKSDTELALKKFKGSFPKLIRGEFRSESEGGGQVRVRGEEKRIFLAAEMEGKKKLLCKHKNIHPQNPPLKKKGSHESVITAMFKNLHIFQLPPLILPQLFSSYNSFLVRIFFVVGETPDFQLRGMEVI